MVYLREKVNKMSLTILNVSNLSKTFGGVVATDP